MRGWALLCGMIIVIIGIVEYSMLKDYLVACESKLDSKNIDLNLLQMCNQLRYAQYGSLLISAIGFCVCIYGIVKRSAPKIVRYD